MAQGSGGGGSNSAPITLGKDVKNTPHGLLDFISSLELLYKQEQKGVVEMLDEDFFTSTDRARAWSLGFRQTIVAGLVTGCLTPFAMGVLEKMIPVFGSTETSAFDEFYIFLLTLSYQIGYACFLGYAATRFYGSYTRVMVKFLLLGIYTASFFKTILLYILFNYIYMAVLTEQHILLVLSYFKTVSFLQPHLYPTYKWLAEFRNVFPLSANFVALTTVMYCVVIATCYVRTVKRNARVKKSVI